MNHTERNMALVEAFGQLEQLCNQIYKDKHGVTAYIDEMTAKQLQGRFVVSHWNAALNRLKELRHKRNKLSHGEVNFQTPYATDMDVQFLRAFYQLILKRADPLAQLHQAESSKKRPPVPRTYAAPPGKTEKSGMGCLIAVAVTLGIMVAAVLIVLLVNFTA